LGDFLFFVFICLSIAMNETPETSGLLRGMDKTYDVLCRICIILAGVALVAMTLMFA